MLPAAEFSIRTIRHKLKYHPHHLDTGHSTTVRLGSWNELLNDLPGAAFSGRHDMGTLKTRYYLHFKYRQRTPSGVARGRGRR